MVHITPTFRQDGFTCIANGGVPTGAEPTTDPTILWSVAKVWVRGQKSTKRGDIVGSASPPRQEGYIQACLYLEADLPWDRHFLYRTSLETTRTSRKPHTDKSYRVPTSCTDKQTGLEN